MKNRIIYVIFSHSGTIPSKIIRIFTHYEYSHVSISLEEKPNEFYSFARKQLNPLVGGFVIENSDSKIYKKFSDTRCRVYEMHITERKYQKIKRMINRYKRRNDEYKYNYLGVLSPILHLPIRISKRRLFCSQFVADILEKGKVIDMDIDPIYVTPQLLHDYIKSKNISRVFDGKVMDYFSIYA